MGTAPGHRKCTPALSVLSGPLKPGMSSPRQALLAPPKAECQHPGRDKTQAAWPSKCGAVAQTNTCFSLKSKKPEPSW